MSKEWFASWFDSEYYHILYKNRDFGEAELFVSSLIERLNPKMTSSFLDLACGKGRHSIFINKMGHHVTGIDLSKNNITEAKKNENETLTFEVHDMREIYKTDAFDYVLNLFTSFGYFDNELDNLNALISIKRALKPNGFLVIDFLNPRDVITNLIENETKVIDGIEFNISREIANEKVEKHIKFEDKGVSHHYTESVQLIDFDKFQTLFNQVGLQITDAFGDYALNLYNEDNSERLIIFAQKL